MMKKFGALFIVQGINYVSPLILIPVLTHRLGVAAWGKISILISLTVFSLVFIEYAFHLSGVRAVAQCKNDEEELNGLFVNVVGAKFILGLMFSTLSCILYFYFLSSYINEIEFLSWLLSTIAQSQTGAWYFQGQQRSVLGFGMEAASRLISTVLAIIVVHVPSDIWKYFISIAIGWAPGILFSMFRAHFFKSLSFFSIRDVYKLLVSGFNAFLLNAWGAFFVSMPTIVLSKVVSLEVVGYFSLADKIVRAMYGIYVPFHTYLFPKIARLAIENKDAAALYVARGLKVCIVSGILVSLSIFLLADNIIVFCFGVDFFPASSVLKMYSLMPTILVINSILVVQWMVNLSVERIYNKWNVIFGFLKLFLVAWLGVRFGAEGAVIAISSSDAACLLASYFSLKKIGLTPFVCELKNV
ncbi:oligosaccharide flippase family protein [Chromobacterium sp. IIBBL 290-4]|uniref:oligosaccharide flippase family protein n=1 Tax=Chromobacterium sp. IIBBL 290-4 TaxID=2953890 RepID=UPI0020B9003C|nr:oligosaccharide flippase family protein [Chromobacterium sp. IIBBL 290-4]UTH72841.1 oligosaccharide flippase family protein [Chromobacterium sp. IIBBL 290-4]